MQDEKLKNHIIARFDKSICLVWRCCQLPLTSKRNMKGRRADVAEKMQRSANVRHLCDDQQHDLVDDKGVASDIFDGVCEEGDW